MNNGKKVQSRVFSLNPRFSYLPDGDRYIFSSPEPQYRFNVIGTGVIGQEHIRVTLLEGRATIHGIYDPNPRSVESAKKEFAKYAPQSSLVVYDTLEQACNDPEVDGLIICTPNYTHIEVLREAVKSGKHILLEKPMATTLPDAYEITKLADDYQATLQVGLQYRYKAIYAEAIHEALVRGTIGAIKTISILEHRVPFLDKVNQWNKFSKYSGGTLVEKCCHYFDLFNLFAQAKPVSVFASGSMAVNFLDFEYDQQKSDILDNAMVIVTYDNGIRANFNLCMFAPMFYEELVLCGDEGRLKASEQTDFVSKPASKYHLEVMCGDDRPSKVSTPTYPTFIEESGHSGSTFYEHVKFVDSIAGKETDTAKADEGFWSVVIGVAAEESIKTGRVVEIEALLAAQDVNVEL